MHSERFHPHCKSGLSSKRADFQLFAMNRSNRSNRNSSTRHGERFKRNPPRIIHPDEIEWTVRRRHVTSLRFVRRKSGYQPPCEPSRHRSRRKRWHHLAARYRRTHTNGLRPRYCSVHQKRIRIPEFTPVTVATGTPVVYAPPAFSDP